jgi:pre-60S factor REI1
MSSRDSVQNVRRRIASLPPVERDEFESTLSEVKGGEEKKKSVGKRKIRARRERGCDAAVAARRRSTSPDVSFTSEEDEEEDEEEQKNDGEVAFSSSSSAKDTDCEDEIGNTGFGNNRADEDKDGVEWPAYDTGTDADGFEQQDTDTTLCLFCRLSLPSHHHLLSHMSAIHNFIIPHPDQLIHLPTFLAYLDRCVREHHECLYCGAVKQTASKVQRHMRDMRHCRLGFEKEGGLWGFWDFQEEDGVEEEGEREGEGEGWEGGGGRVEIGDAEMRLANGRVVGSRFARVNVSSTTRRTSRLEQAQASASTHLALPHSALASSSSDLPSRQLSLRRAEMGLAGLSEHQRAALVLSEKKAQRCELAARRAREWVRARGANAYKHDQVDTGKGKWGKQNHRLLPR